MQNRIVSLPVRAILHMVQRLLRNIGKRFRSRIRTCRIVPTFAPAGCKRMQTCKSGAKMRQPFRVDPFPVEHVHREKDAASRIRSIRPECATVLREGSAWNGDVRGRRRVEERTLPGTLPAFLFSGIRFETGKGCKSRGTHLLI